MHLIVAKFIAPLFLLLFLLVFFSPRAAFAESIKSFDDTIIIHHDGTANVTENIQYDFGDIQHHGIIRDIPYTVSLGNGLYRQLQFTVTSVSRDGASEAYATSSTANNELEIKIGNPDFTMEGVQNYVVSYSVMNGVGNYSDHDEFYWNITGNNWTVPIDEASVHVTSDFASIPGNTVCYTGVYGSKASNCTITDVANGKSIVSNAALNPGEGLNFVTSFPVNTFPKSIVQQGSTPASDAANAKASIEVIVVWLIFNIVVSLLIIIWYFKQRHKNRFGPVVVNFDLPKTSNGTRVTPVEAGTIDKKTLYQQYLTATIFDLAVRKYLRIEEVDTKGVFLGIGKSTDYKLIKLKDFTDLDNFERTLLSDLFDSKSEILLSKTKTTYSQFTDLSTINYTSLVDKGLYAKGAAPYTIPLAIGMILSGMTFNWLILFVLLYVRTKLTSRTTEGDQLSWKIDGLKLFLKNMKREYQWQADQVYVVEQMIPYAIALGYIDKFMEQLKILNPNYQPTFYRGTNSFYLMYPAFNSSFSHAVNYTAPASSSGFSSGGFSGGGGGGGGGGSW